MLRIDHVLVAATGLEAAAERLFAETGLASVPGGRHEGLGTENRLVPLGDDYVELIGVAGDEAAALSPIAQWVAARGDGPLGWCVATDDLDGVAARLGLTPLAASRTLPDGSAVSWRMAGAEVSLEDPSLPFFISWDGPPERHPGRSPAAHRCDPRRIAWVEVAGDAARLREWLGGAPIPVRTVGGDGGVVAAGIETSSGEIVLR